MKKRALPVLILILSLCFSSGILASGEYGSEILYYEDDYIYFEYDSELLGTISKEYDGNFHYNCKSHSGDFVTSIRIIDKDEYIESVGGDFVTKVIEADSDSAYTRKKTNENYPEVKLVNTLDGNVSYIKLIGESVNSWLVAEIDEPNENDSVIGNMFRQIYDTVEPTDYWLENGYAIEYSSNFPGEVNIKAGKEVY